MSSSAHDPVSFDFNDDPTVTDEIVVRNNWFIVYEFNATNYDSFTRYKTSYDNRDQILFVVDCGPEMNKPEPNGRIPIKVAFDCIKSVTLSKIFAATSDRVGVLLYNTVSQEHKEGV